MRPYAGRPFLFLNLAITADGKIASAGRSIRSFSSPRDFEHLLELRATADAIMCGRRTLAADPITLGPGPERFRRLRRRRGLAEYPLRIVVSGTASIDPDAEIFRHHFSPIILLASERAPKRKLRALARVVDTIRISGTREIEFHGALRWLRREWNVKRLLCEGGGELNAALFAAGVVDEVHLTICPKLFGGATAPTLADGLGAPTLADATQFELKSMKRVGAELFVVYRVLHRHPACR